MNAIEHPLEFERPIVELEAELQVVRDEIAAGNESKTAEYNKLSAKLEKLQADLYGKLSAYQRVQLSRHFDRPFALDYIRLMMTDFIELHGDRLYGDDKAIVGGTARFADLPVMVVGHQRGRTTQERLERNFGMPQPEGYRKALRLFRLAEKFAMPIVTFIDTQGAYPGLEAEERGQSEAIARNLAELAEITVPIISVVIGEGGSGGALALGVSDRILMLENACYSVITPEGCASILWKVGRGETAVQYAPAAADALQITAESLKRLGIADEIVKEPLGGAHRNHKETAENLKDVLTRQLAELSKLSVSELVEARYQKFRKIGALSTN